MVADPSPPRVIMANSAGPDFKAPAQEPPASSAANNGEQEQEWTKVRRKTRRGTKPRQGASQKPQTGALIAVPAPRAVAASDLSAKDIQDQHQRIRDLFIESECHKSLEHIIKTKFADASHVSQAVCLGIGTFDPEDGAWEVKRRTHVQLAAFLSIITLLEEKQKGPIKCYFQEPVFSTHDAEFIRQLGHQVVDTPAGFSLVDESTLVFGVHLYRNVYSRAIAKAIPAVFIGTGYDVWDNYHDTQDLDLERLKKVQEECEKIIFPQDKGYTTFTSTSFHWRKTNSKD